VVDRKLDVDFRCVLQEVFLLEFLPNLLTTLRHAGKNFQSVFYYPIDGIPKQSWIEAAASVDHPVTYTQFGFDESVKLVPSLEDRLKIIPHGFNPKVFFPAPPEQVESFRKQYLGALADKFIVTNVNRNQQRKDIPATVRAFIEFRKHCPDSVLYLHMMAKDQGWDLPAVLTSFGLDMSKDVILPQNFTASNGFPLEILNLIYNASDCVISTTVGEGWGLSWTEAMGTKTPVVFPQNTCLTQYITEETGWPYPSGGDMDHITVIPHDNEVPRPTAHIHKMVEQMVALYNNPEEGKKRAEAAFEMVSNNLVWDKHINPQWLDLFDSIDTSGAPAPAAQNPQAQKLRGEML
jgi:glycosyltransferase involved in cell wall biosynthesis